MTLKKDDHVYVCNITQVQKPYTNSNCNKQQMFQCDKENLVHTDL